jgi:hypothetical protein
VFDVRTGKLLNPVSKQDNMAMLDQVVVKGKVAMYNSLVMDYDDVPDGEVVMLAYPLPKRKYFGNNPQVHVLPMYYNLVTVDVFSCCFVLQLLANVMLLYWYIPTIPLIFGLQTPIILCPWSKGMEAWPFSYDEAQYAIPVAFFEARFEFDDCFYITRLAFVQHLAKLNVDAMPAW